jgi:hypothetical protein
MNACQSNNITSQWKHATIAADVTACTGLGGITGSYMVRQKEAPRSMTAICISVGSHALIIVLAGTCTLLFWRAIGGRGREKG